MTFGFITIKVSFDVSNNLCQAQAAHAGRKMGMYYNFAGCLIV